MILWELFIGFLKVGLFSFGGAYGAIPLIRETVLAHGWVEEDVLSAMIAVSESTPGPIMVNMATYIGRTCAGFPGAILATTAVVLPAFVIILWILLAMKTLSSAPAVQAVLRGVTPCVVGIILSVGVFLLVETCGLAGEKTGVDVRALVITLLLGGFVFVYKKRKKKKFPPIGLILMAAGLGMLFYSL